MKPNAKWLCSAAAAAITAGSAGQQLVAPLLSAGGRVDASGNITVVGPLAVGTVSVGSTTAELGPVPCWLGQAGADPCDTNCDGSVNGLDISLFIAILNGAAGCSPEAGDANGDGSVNGLDISGFAACLSP